MAPRFSVVLATHDRPALLTFAIASVLAQEHPDFELLIVGDGCGEATAQVVASFADPRIRWFDLPKAPGFGYANRNAALRASSGELLAFVADDDLIFPDHLSVLAATLDRDDADWAYSRPLWVTPDGLVVPFASNLSNADELQTFLATANHVPATCVMYRRRCLESYGYWPEDVLRAGDWRYWIRIIEGGGRARLACSPIPTSLHFHAGWKEGAAAEMPQVRAAREIAAGAIWWPASLKVTIPHGVPEQQIFAAKMTAKDVVALRADVDRVIDRLAWMRLDDVREPPSTLAAELAESRVSLEDARRTIDRLGQDTSELQHATASLTAELEILRASRSWRVTAPMRALARMLRAKA